MITLEQAQKAIGQRVTFSDGTPKPPARNVKQVKQWEYNNGSGTLEKVEPHGRYCDVKTGSVKTDDGKRELATFIRISHLSELSIDAEQPRPEPQRAAERPAQNAEQTSLF